MVNIRELYHNYKDYADQGSYIQLRNPCEIVQFVIVYNLKRLKKCTIINENGRTQ